MSNRLSVGVLVSGVTLAHLTFSTPLLAQSETTVVMLTLQGTCWLRVEGKELPCVPKLLNTNYPSGRTGFYIVGADDSTYSWSGKGGNKPNLDLQVLQVDQFIMIAKGKKLGVPAKGRCEYQNLYLGKPTSLTCSAKYGKRVAKFRFEHDGLQPVKDDLPTP
jgi:hypothetical protein